MGMLAVSTSSLFTFMRGPKGRKRSSLRNSCFCSPRKVSSYSVPLSFSVRAMPAVMKRHWEQWRKETISTNTHMWTRTSKATFQRNLKLKDKYYKDKHTDIQRHKREGRHQDYECRHSKACQISWWKNPGERNTLLLSGWWDVGFSVRFVSTFVFGCCQRSCVWAILQNWSQVRVGNI